MICKKIFISRFLLIILSIIHLWPYLFIFSIIKEKINIITKYNKIFNIKISISMKNIVNIYNIILFRISKKKKFILIRRKNIYIYSFMLYM